MIDAVLLRRDLRFHVGMLILMGHEQRRSRRDTYLRLDVSMYRRDDVAEWTKEEEVGGAACVSR